MDRVQWQDVIFFKGLDNPELADKLILKLREYAGQNPRVEHINYHKFSDCEFDDAFASCATIKNKVVVFFECLKDLETVIRFLQVCWAAKYRYGAKYVIATVSFMHYRRQDRPEKFEEIPRNDWLIEMLKYNGVDELIVTTPHSEYMAKNCHKHGIAFRAVDPSEAFASVLRPLLPEKDDGKKAIIYAPDEGSIQRAIALAHFLDVGVLFNLKHRAFDNETSMIDADEKMIQGIIDKYHFADLKYATPELIKDIYVIMVEDEVDTGGTGNRQGRLLRQYGAAAVFFCATHAVFSNGYKRKFFSHNPFAKIIMCNTVLRTAEQRTGGLIHDVQMAGLIASAIYRVLQKRFK